MFDCDQLPQEPLGLSIVALVSLQFGQEFLALDRIGVVGALTFPGKRERLTRQCLGSVEQAQIAVCLGNDFK